MRPSTFTQETADTICERIANGEHPVLGEAIPDVVAEFFNDRLEPHGGKPTV